MIERTERDIHRAQKFSQIRQKFRRMGLRLYQRLAGKKSKHPYQASLARRILPWLKRSFFPGLLHTRQWQMLAVLRQVLQRSTLHINKRAFPRRVHALQYKFAAVICMQMKIGVVFARQALRRYRHAV